MRSATTPLLLFALTGLLAAGCASERPYYAAVPPPPPPSYGPPVGAPPLVEYAEREGFRAGLEDGRRDAYSRFGYHPQHDRNFHEAPGYDPRLGPLRAYREYFRGAYLRGYSRGFGRG